jgi:hypothetical protein
MMIAEYFNCVGSDDSALLTIAKMALQTLLWFGLEYIGSIIIKMLIEVIIWE